MSQGAVNILIVSAISRLGLVTQFVHFRLCDRFQLQKREDSCILLKEAWSISLLLHNNTLEVIQTSLMVVVSPPPLLLPSDPTLTEIGVFYWYLKKIHDMTTLFGLRKTWIQQRLKYTMCVHRVGLTSRGAHTLISQGFPNTHTHTHTHTHTWGIPWTDFVCHLRGRRLHQIEGWCDVI